MNYIRVLYPPRYRELLLSLSDLDNLHRRVPILSSPLTLAGARLRAAGRKGGRKEREEKTYVIIPSRSRSLSYAAERYSRAAVDMVEPQREGRARRWA